MPRPLIGAQETEQRASDLNLADRTKTPDAPAAPLHLGRRSPVFLAALAKLEVAGAAQVDVTEAIEAIRAEFPPQAAVPLGYLTVCYLGPPFEVHILDLVGEIVQHYRVGEALPTPYAGARRLALHAAYEAIEVYPDRYVCIRGDGTTTEVAT